MLSVSSLSVSAQSSQQNESSVDQSIPEKDGDYPDPGHKGVRVRVFVHGPKQKPIPGVSNICTDSDSTAVVGKTGWHLPSSVAYNLNVSSVPASISAGNLATFSASSFQVWQAAAGEKVIFNRGSDTSLTRSAYDGKNILAWGRTSSGALAVTYARYYSSTGLVADVDTIMNKKYVWSWTDPSTNACSLYPNTYDAQDILTHELGHWLGLNDEYSSSYVDNTMYGYGSKGEIKKNTLTIGDKANLSTIYP